MLRAWFQASIYLCVLLLLHSAAIAQNEPLTADEVVSRYREAIGASRYPTITTFVESGELDGNLTNFWQGYRSPWQSHATQHGTFESYFKSPNLRFQSTVTEKNQIIALHGCDGKVAWYIDAFLQRTQFKPKPGNEGECKDGFLPPLSGLSEPNAKMRLLKKKEVDGRMAWEVKVEEHKSPGTQTYYFDAETFLLLRFEQMGTHVSYSDYRDVGGIKFPFTTIQEFTNSKLVTTLREVKINTLIEDAKFLEPQVKGGKLVWSAVAVKGDGAGASAAPATPLAANAEAPKVTQAPEASKISPPQPSGTHDAGSVVEVNFPNFTSCPVAELELAVPDLKGLKVSDDQQKLAGLLDKVGATMLELARNTPNLIARERVSAPLDRSENPHDYDYLILAHLEQNMVLLDEFRLDLKSGEKFQTDDVMNGKPLQRADLERASSGVANSKAAGPPMSEGFATSWVHFYPTNRTRATYRYLGEEKIDGHRTLVLAFAQKPELVPRPAMFRYQDKTAAIFLQGIAWVDPSDFRILRLRTDLLSPVPEVALHRWTADIQFGPTRIEQIANPLQLPRKVTVTTSLGGAVTREVHDYSEYRLFRAKSRIIAMP